MERVFSPARNYSPRDTPGHAFSFTLTLTVHLHYITNPWQRASPDATMGKLLALELFNFKSYKGHHVMQFGDSYFTSIIGPNGSGKSNSMDAISFVLGIKSSHLRSTHLKDLVYRGRVLKHAKIAADGTATEDATNGDAEAGASDEETQTSTQQARSDPQTAWVMAVFEDDAGEEQKWKRSITAAGTSEYRINNRPVTSKMYNEALEAENILIKARNFLVFQGDVEQIASQSPKDLTRLIEQISGSLEYKAEYERLKLEKEKADEEQGYKLQQRRGINGEIKQYQQQKEELDKFEQTRDEKEQAVVTQVLWKLFHFQRTIEESTSEIQKHQAELKEFRRNVQKYQDRLEAAKTEQAKSGREVHKCEREIKRREKEVEEKENALVPVEERLSINQSNVDKAEAHRRTIVKEHDMHQTAHDKWSNNLENVQTARTRWEKEYREKLQQAGRALSEKDEVELQRLRAEVSKRAGDDQRKITSITRELQSDEQTAKSLKSQLDNNDAQVEAMEAEISVLQERRNELAGTLKATGKEFEKKNLAINSLVSDRDRTDQMKRELDEKLHTVLTKLQEAQGFQRESQKEANQREIVSQLKRIYPGVRGQLGLLCRPKQKKYEVALATVLGRHYDSIVVDSEKTARECIQYLKDQRSGQLTFIPLDTIIHKQPNANLRGMHPGMRLGIDTIDFDTNLERAMGFACGDAIVTDTIAIAKTLIFQRNVDAKAVVLDGTVIHKGGNMTGGASTFDKKRRFEDAEVDALRSHVEKFRADIEALPKGHKRQAEEEQLRSELVGLETKQRYLKEELKALDRNIESKTRELKHLQSQVKELRPRFEKQNRGVESLRRSLEEYQSSAAEVEDEVFADFCQRLGYSDIREYDKQQGAYEAENRERMRDYKSQLSRLEQTVESEKQKLRACSVRLDAAMSQTQKHHDKVAECQALKEQLDGELEQLNEQIEELNGKLEDLKKEFDERGEIVQEARRELQKRSKGVDSTLKEISGLEADMQKASTGRYGVLRTCKVENISLPLERGSRKIDALPLEDAMLDDDDDEDAMDVDEDDGNAALAKIKDYGIHVDFDKLDEDLQEDGSEECEAALAENISNLQTALDKMAPNMRSADRLETTSHRLKATEDEFNAARNAAKSANKDFEAVRKIRMDLFKKAFDQISEQIGNVYRALTKTQSFPLGGSASLDVEDDDEPYLSGVKYHAMPPLKRFRDMEHLSGGEKTMAALALLFAIHQFKPSPFFVLDEVDAALDHANTTQLAQYVKEHAGPGYQFVVISLKTGLFQNSETLVGVMRDQGVNSSRALTLDVSFDITVPEILECVANFVSQLRKYQAV